MSSDSDVGSDFLEGLKEIGLFDGDIPKPEKSKNNQTKKVNKGSKRPPKRKPINLDALMDGLELSGINNNKTTTTEEYAPVPTKKTDLESRPVYSPTVALSPISSIEKSIESYLSRSVRILMDEFTVELSHMLDSCGEFDKQTEDWLDNLKQTVREEIALQQRSNDAQKGNVLMGIDTIGIGFKDVFQEAEMHKNVSIPQRLRDMRNSSASVSSHISSLKTQMSFDELSDEVKALNEVRSKFMRQSRSSAKRARSQFMNVLELEAEKERQNTESQIIEQKLFRINENRKKLEDIDFEYESDLKSDMKMKLRELIDSFTTRVLDKPRTPVTWQFRAIDDAREKAASTRRAYELELDQLLMRLESIPVAAMMHSMPVSHAPSQRVEPKVVEVANNDKTLMQVREALNDFQKRRKTTIDSTTEFLSTIKRKERKRVEKEVSKTMSRDLEMDTLFSVL